MRILQKGFYYKVLLDNPDFPHMKEVPFTILDILNKPGSRQHIYKVKIADTITEITLGNEVEVKLITEKQFKKLSIKITLQGGVPTNADDLSV